MSTLETKQPEFTLALRGYDRGQVDQYIQQLYELIDEAEARARSAQSEAAGLDEHAAIGPRIAEIFTLAETEARDLRDRTRQESVAVLRGARAEAEAIIEEAQRNARELQVRADENYDAVMAELDQDRERIREDTEKLERRKGQALTAMRRIREVLAQAEAAADVAELPPASDPYEAATTVLPAVAQAGGLSDAGTYAGPVEDGVAAEHAAVVSATD